MIPAAANNQDPFGDATFPSAPPPPSGGAFPLNYPNGQYGAYGAPSYNTYASGAYGNAMYGSGYYGQVYGAGGGRYGSLLAGAQNVRDGGTAVISGMHEAMQRFARISALIEEVLRNLHMLFDGIFGLGYSLGAFYDESSRWLVVKSGPRAFLKRLIYNIARVWRLVVLFLCSPMAGRFSPVALALRIIGIVPEESYTELADRTGLVAEFMSSEASDRASLPAYPREEIWPRDDSSNL